MIILKFHSVKIVLSILLTASVLQVFGQAKTRRLPNSINHPSLNVFAPYISANGNAIVFVSDNAEDGVLTPFFSFKESGDWSQPVVVPKNLHTRLNFLKGYALSADGKKMFLTTIKGPGVGGYDLWTSEWKSNAWSEPTNFGLPINTRSHEATPSFSVDGNTIFFMRCENMDQGAAGNCTIWMATKKNNGQWNEPVMLPANINTGNSQTPRILADGETLIFSSDKMAGSKGGMDLFVSKRNGDVWANPIPMTFVNTAEDDQYVCVDATGRYLLKDTRGIRKNEIIEYLIPDELRPATLVKVEGVITADGSESTSSYVSVYDLISKRSVYNAAPMREGNFLVYLKEGGHYELAVDPADDHFTFFSKRYDLKKESFGPDRIMAKIQPIVAGTELDLGGIVFQPFSSTIDGDMSANELKRVSRMINANPDFHFELQVLLSGYTESSAAADPDLTEQLTDSITSQLITLDSAGNEIVTDTLEIKTRYHNDRTIKQGQEIMRHLAMHGVDTSRMSLITNSREAVLPEDRNLTIRLVAVK